MSDSIPPQSPPPPPTGQAPPGWYPTTPGVQGYWDGQKWTGDVAPLAPAAGPDDNTMAMLAHVLGIFTGFVGPLVLYLVKKDESPFIRSQAAEALNFQITLMISYIGSLILFLVLIGILTFLVTMVLGFIFPIMGAVAANRGENYRYPISIRFVD